MNSAIDTMVGVLRPLAITLAGLPVGPEYRGFTAGFPFEMFYAMGNLVPDREAAWTLLHERASILAARCADLGDEAATAGEHATAMTANLAAHLPADLLRRT